MGTIGTQSSDSTAGTPEGGKAPEEPRLLVLNAAVLKKMTTAAALAEATGIAVTDVEALLDSLEADDAVARLDADVLATETGMAEVKEYADRHYGAVRDDPRMEPWLAEFNAINQQFLKATTAWQILPVGEGQVPNDHSDPGYDAKVLSRIEKLVTKTVGLLDEMAARVPRFASYAKRLNAALSRVDDGDLRYISDPLVDSVHTVWFEMHEDILIVLGQERTE